jgi:hypothetical protein
MERTFDEVQIAKVCYAVNRTFCRASESSWDDIDPATQSEYITAINSYLSNPNLTPETVHDTWVEFMVDSGWSPGAFIDPDDKTHPNLVSYTDLPFTERLKDEIFMTVVRTMKDL